MNVRVEQMIKEIVELVRPKALYVYGSYIRASCKNNSDIDLLLVVKDDPCLDVLFEFTKKCPLWT